MKRILATTAMTLLLSTAAMADDHMSSFKTYDEPGVMDIYASDFIGMRVYSAQKDYDTFDENATVDAGAETEWDDIGEVNDIILNRDGSVKAVILGVGGFLGVGEKDVSVDMGSIKMVNETGDEGDFFLVVDANKQVLTDAPNFERMMENAEDRMDAAGAKIKSYADDTVEDVSKTMKDAKDNMAQTTSEAKDSMVKTMNEIQRETFGAPNIERDGWNVVEISELTADDLTGARLYSVKDEDIGEIDKLLVNETGEIEKAVLDIGGFLGIGERRIAVPMDELEILRTDSGADVRVYIDATQEELENQPEYSGS
ncbi:PRC-barrel domain-containing protein [Cohaesibacter marisflavi]|uniref:PRC-barrel domain-containing protein n=1 Tax=Cohaesibacter marisflavi TaxID=655353 RepID=A0A1I5H5S4_9HYPH|nr:PRC-barrel domain-containing protein [Cohaesibacter marisflavi]SFO43605.1 PRC-barrel domain-containing protein [Cohaesibacter marisflavi]